MPGYSTCVKNIMYIEINVNVLREKDRDRERERKTEKRRKEMNKDENTVLMLQRVYFD